MIRRSLAAIVGVFVVFSLAACGEREPSPCADGYAFDRDDNECEPDDSHYYLMPYPVVLYGSGSSAYYAPATGYAPNRVRPGYTVPKAQPKPNAPVYKAPSAPRPVYKAPSAPRPVVRAR